MPTATTRPPTDTPYPVGGDDAFPTPVPDVVQWKDISSVYLRLDDLPSGYYQLTEQDLVDMGMSDAEMAADFTEGLSLATLVNTKAYLNETDETVYELVYSTVVYPLTYLEQASFDIDVLDEDALTASFSENFGNPATILPGANTFGNKSIGLQFVDESEGYPLRGQFIMARRGPAVSLVMVIYLADLPPVSAADLTRILDGRLQAALQ